MDYSNQNINYYIPEQRIIEDNYADSRSNNQMYAIAQIQAEKEIYVAQCKQQIATDAAAKRNLQKLIQREEIEELRRGAFQEVRISEDGEIISVTKNIFKDAKPRIITNIFLPELDRYIRLSRQTDMAYCLSCAINDFDAEIFFDASKIGSAAYLLKKFTASGIIFYADKPAQQKSYAQQLLALLLQNDIPDHFVADAPGWLQLPDGNFTFAEEGSILWKKIMAAMQ